MSLLQRLIWAAVIGTILVYLSRALSYRRRRNGCKPIPGPKGYPIVGNIFDLPGPNLLPAFIKWNKEYGPIVTFTILGRQQIVLGTEKVTNDLFVKRGNNYSERGMPPALSRVSRGLVPALRPMDDRWRRQRKFLHSMLAATVASTYEPYIALESTYTLWDLLDSPQSFNNHIEKYAYALVFRLALGQKVDSMQDDAIQENTRRIDQVLEAFRPDKYPSNIMPFLLKLPTWLVPSNAKLDSIANATNAQTHLHHDDVKRKISEGSAAKSWMRNFIENRDTLDIETEEALWALHSLLGAGTRSPYNAILGFVIDMMENPAWQEKMQEEVDQVVGSDRLPSFEDLSNLPIVRAIVKESIRWRSVVAELGVPHMTNQDDYYEGYFIPKGTIIHANYSSILTEPHMYPDGRVYNPDRWLNPAFPTYKEPLTTYPNLTNFTPFGYGRRACPGANFTERTLTVMVARIAWACNIKKPVDLATKQEVQLNIQYEPTPNPKPLPFPANITARDPRRAELVRKEAEQARKTDPLAADL